MKYNKIKEQKNRVITNLHIPINRLKHCYATGKIMEYIGKIIGASEEEQYEMFALGYIHDAMYDFETDASTDAHAKIASKIFGEKFMNEILHHSAVTDNFHSKWLDFLYLADMMSAGDGRDKIVISMAERMKDIEARHGHDKVYYESKKIVNYLYSLKYINFKKLEFQILKHFTNLSNIVINP